MAGVNPMSAPRALNHTARASVLVFPGAVMMLFLGGFACAALRWSPAPCPAPTPPTTQPRPVAEANPAPEPEPIRRLAGPLPRLAISIAELLKLGGHDAKLAVTENRFISDWEEAGFVFKQMDVNQSGRIKLRDDVDVLLIGTAFTVSHGGVSELLSDTRETEEGLFACEASLSVRAFDQKAGKILASVVVSRTTLHIDPFICARNALDNAAAKAAPALQKEILEHWKPQ
jgi:hypothetical protein